MSYLYSLEGIGGLSGCLKTFQINGVPTHLDFSALANLSLLEKIVANNCGITDISFLSNLTRLQSIELSNNYISDLKPLENLTNLTDLDLQDNIIYDTSYYLNDNGDKVYYSNLGIIANLKNNHSLTTVLLSGNGTITDWTPVSDISGWDSSSYSGWTE